MRPKLSTIILLFATFFAIMADGSLAQTVDIPNPLGASDIPTLVDTIANWLLGIGLTISTIVILWAALQFVVAGGSEERVSKARKTLWYAIIGMTVLLLAKGVTSVIKAFLSGQF